MNGYIGKILDVDLNTSRLADRSIDEKTARKFLGGKGLGLALIYDELKPDVDLLGTDNIIVFATDLRQAPVFRPAAGHGLAM